MRCVLMSICNTGKKQLEHDCTVRSVGLLLGVRCYCAARGGTWHPAATSLQDGEAERLLNSAGIAAAAAALRASNDSAEQQRTLSPTDPAATVHWLTATTAAEAYYYLDERLWTSFLRTPRYRGAASSRYVATPVGITTGSCHLLDAH